MFVGSTLAFQRCSVHCLAKIVLKIFAFSRYQSNLLSVKIGEIIGIFLSLQNILKIVQ